MQVLLLSTKWYKVASRVFKCIKEHRWLATCISSYIVQNDWIQVRWEREFSMYTSTTSSPYLASITHAFPSYFFLLTTMIGICVNSQVTCDGTCVDYWGNFYSYKGGHLLKNDILPHTTLLYLMDMQAYKPFDPSYILYLHTLENVLLMNLS